MRPHRKNCAGQSILESCIVVAVTCLIFFGLFQVSQLYSAKAVLTYSAVAGARARMVGFNDFMVYKVVRSAAIPNAGPMVNPVMTRGGGIPAMVTGSRPGVFWNTALRSPSPSSPQYNIEQSRIPLYLGAERWGELPAILDYENWDDISYGEGGSTPDLVLAEAHQNYELVWPFARSFYADDHVRMDSSGESGMIVRDKHYPLYLEVNE